MKKFSGDVAAAISMAASKRGISACLLAGLVQRESAGVATAVRYEPDFIYLWDVVRGVPYRVQRPCPPVPPPDFRTLTGGVHVQLEWTLQKCSLGACQVMGSVAREMGFAGPYLTDLFDPVVGIDLGAKKLAMLLGKYEEDDAVSAYNAGRPTDANRDYVSQILHYRDYLAKEGF